MSDLVFTHDTRGENSPLSSGMIVKNLTPGNNAKKPSSKKEKSLNLGTITFVIFISPIETKRQGQSAITFLCNPSEKDLGALIGNATKFKNNYKSLSKKKEMVLRMWKSLSFIH